MFGSLYFDIYRYSMSTNLRLGFASKKDSKCTMCKKDFNYVYQLFEDDFHNFVCKKCFEEIGKQNNKKIKLHNEKSTY